MFSLTYTPDPTLQFDLVLTASSPAVTYRPLQASIQSRSEHCSAVCSISLSTSYILIPVRLPAPIIQRTACNQLPILGTTGSTLKFQHLFTCFPLTSFCSVFLA